MEEYFMDKDHSDRFLLLANELKFANFEDSEWRTAIFLISSSEKLFMNRKSLIDFEDRSIHAEKWFRNPYSSGEKRLLALAYNLFTALDYYEFSNGERYYISPFEIFAYLDSDYREVATNAIKFRFLVS